MKIKNFLLSLFFLFGISEIYAQEKSTLTLDEAINLALTKSTEANLANTKVASSQYELQTVKNNQYPTLKISGQYQRLTEANVNFKINTGGSSAQEGETTASPKVNQLVLGQASLAVPLFSGFKIRNSIKASENMLQAETYNAKNTKEQLAMNVVVLYVNLYKAQQSVALINENIVSAKQRVKDFTAMEENGLIARNDLLKAQLQASNIQLSLDEAKKQVTTISYQLATLLRLPDNTQITPSDAIFGNALNVAATINENDALEGRSDLESLRWQQKASETNIKIAQANYYPSLSLTGGYVAFNLQNVLEVTNAVNFGIGLSYDLSSVFKNNKEVKLATSRASETRQYVELLTDRVKVEVQEAQENYTLMIKQNKVYVEATGQATENYRIVKDKYDNGLSDTNDLLEADVQQLQSKINEAYSKADITQSYYALLNASGKLTNSFNLTKN